MSSSTNFSAANPKLTKQAITPNWYVYLLRCADDSLYAGICIDLQRRLMEHNHDNKKAARYTRVRRPVEMVYHEPCSDRAHASQREYQLKKMSRQQKLLMIGSGSGVVAGE